MDNLAKDYKKSVDNLFENYETTMKCLNASLTKLSEHAWVLFFGFEQTCIALSIFVFHFLNTLFTVELYP